MNTICVLRDITVVRGEHYNFYVQEHCGEGNRYLQNTVVGCPRTVLRLFCYCQNHGFGSPRVSSVAELDLHLVAFKRNFNFFFCSVSWQ